MTMPKMRSWLDDFVVDLRFGGRLMRRNRVFSAIAVITLALGIGANSAVFSLLDAVVLHPLPYPQPDQLQMLWTVEGRSQRAHNVSYPDFQDWRQARSFEGMAAFHGASFNVTGAPGAEHLYGLACSPGLLEVLGVGPSLGRTISASDGRRVAVISHRVWTDRFGQDRAALGRTIRLDGDDYLVVGVLPRGFHFQPRLNDEPEILVPMEPVPYRTSFFLRVVGRLRPGVSRDTAQTEMNGIARRIVAEHAELDRRQGVRVDPMHRQATQSAETIALLLAGAVAFLLLIACANVANLLLSRGIGREREMSMRAAIGASRSRLVRQMLTESLLIAFLGGLLGLALASVSLPFLASMAPQWTSFFSRVQDNGVHLSATVLGFTAAVSLVAAIVFGTLPAMKVTRPLTSSAARLRTSRVSKALVSVEVALSFVLLAGAGLMVNSLYRLLNTDPGFRTGGLVTMAVSLPEKAYPTDESRATYVERALDRLQQVTGVRAAGAVSALPLTGDYSTNSFQVDEASRREASAHFESISAEYFRAMETPMAEGRALTAADRAGTSPVVIVNETLARRYWPHGGAVGKALIVSRMSSVHTSAGRELKNTPQRVEIVGVVRNIRQWLDVEARPELYLPFPQRAEDSMTFVLRLAPGARPGAVAQAARAELARLDLDLPVTDVKTMDEWIGIETAPTRFVFALIGIFALVALMLAAFGIYGVVAHAVSRRTHEIAVRLSLGAPPASVVALVARQHLWWVLGGVVAGIGGALAVTRLLERYLYGVHPTDVTTYAVVAVGLLVVALVANLVPASRAATVEPLTILRAE